MADKATDDVVMTDWGEINYSGGYPVVEIPAIPVDPGGEPAPGPENAQTIFQWDWKKYPSSYKELSFEEELANRWRKMSAARADAVVQRLAEMGRKEEAIADLMRQAEAKLAAAEAERSAAATLRKEMENERRQWLERVHESNEEDRLHWERTLKEERIQRMSAEGLLHDLASTLMSLSRNLVTNEMDLIPALQNFGHDFRDKLTTSPPGSTEDHAAYRKALLHCTRELLDALDERRRQSLPRKSLAAVDQPFQLGKTGPTVGGTDPGKVVTIPSRAMPTVIKLASGGGQRRPSETSMFAEDENAAVRSGTRSSLLLSSQQSDRTDPRIKAMWNQTDNQTMEYCSQPPGLVHSDLSRSRMVASMDSSIPCSQPSEAAADGAARPVAPIRQSLAARKSIKPVHRISASADTENLPLFPPPAAAAGSEPPPDTNEFQIFSDDPSYRAPAGNGFRLFSDEPDGPGQGYLPTVRPPTTTENMEKEHGDESENTPPLESIQASVAASRPQHRVVSGVLNDSLEHPGVPVERLTQQDFIEVAESDSDTESQKYQRPGFAGQQQVPQDAQRARLSSQMSFGQAPPQPPPRKSIHQSYFDGGGQSRRSMGPLGFGDFQSEFNVTFADNGRKSIGGAGDQTLLLPADFDQDVFFNNIDPLKRMTSTPLVLGITEDQAYKERMRNKPRASYLAPAGASKLPLSPITEGSRENKSTTPSSSGVSTWIRSKKSLANYSPVDEHDEAGGDKSTGGNKSSH